MVPFDVAGHRKTHQSEQDHKHHEGNNKTIRQLGLMPGIGGFPEYGDLVGWHRALRVVRYGLKASSSIASNLQSDIEKRKQDFYLLYLLS
jgi:hypothetical protein